MISIELFKAFLNVQESIKARHVRATSEQISFFAPVSNEALIVDTFEPVFCKVIYKPTEQKYNYFVLQ